MALSGSFTYAIPGCQGWDSLRVNWSASQNINNNTSTITAVGYIVRTAYGALYAHANTSSLCIDGSWYNGWGNIGGGNNTTTELIRATKTVTHNSDGNRSFSLALNQNMQLTFSGTYIGWAYSGYHTFSLNQIPRQSVFTSISTPQFPNNPTINIRRYSSSYTAALYANIAGVTQKFDMGYASSYTPTLNASIQDKILDQFRNNQDSTIYWTLETYSGSTKIGSTQSSSSKILLPPGSEPTPGIVQVDEVNSVLAGLKNQYLDISGSKPDASVQISMVRNGNFANASAFWRDWGQSTRSTKSVGSDSTGTAWPSNGGEVYTINSAGDGQYGIAQDNIAVKGNTAYVVTFWMTGAAGTKISVQTGSTDSTAGDSLRLTDLTKSVSGLEKMVYTFTTDANAVRTNLYLGANSYAATQIFTLVSMYPGKAATSTQWYANYEDSLYNATQIIGSLVPYEQGISNLKFTATGSTAKAGATIAKQVITFNGLNVNSGSTTGALNFYGSNIHYVLTVTDSRGLTATKDMGTLNINDDSSFSGELTATRALAEDDNGTTTSSTDIATTWGVTVPTIMYNIASDLGVVAASVSLNITNGGTSVSGFPVAVSVKAGDMTAVSDAPNTYGLENVAKTYSGFSESDSYEVQLTIKSIFGQTKTLISTIDAVAVIMAWGKKAVAIGGEPRDININPFDDYPDQVSSSDPVLQVQGDADFHGNTQVTGNLNIISGKNQSGMPKSGIGVYSPSGNHWAQITSPEDNSIMFTMGSMFTRISQGNQLLFRAPSNMGYSDTAVNGYIGVNGNGGELRVVDSDNIGNYRPIRSSQFITNSSRKGKTMIQDFDAKASDIIANLRVTKYHRLNTSADGGFESRPEVGLIAEEAPDILLNDSKDAINLYAYVSVLAKALQEQIAKNSDQAKTIAELQDNLTGLTQAVSNIANAVDNKK